MADDTPRKRGRPPGSGRAVGSRNRIPTDVRLEILTVYRDIGGTENLAKWARKNETDFYKLYARLLPREITGNVNLNHSSDVGKALADALLAVTEARRVRALESTPLPHRKPHTFDATPLDPSRVPRIVDALAEADATQILGEPAKPAKPPPKFPKPTQAQKDAFAAVQAKLAPASNAISPAPFIVSPTKPLESPSPPPIPPHLPIAPTPSVVSDPPSLPSAPNNLNTDKPPD